MNITKGEITSGRFVVPYRIYGEAQKTIVCISGAKQTMAAWRSFVSHFVADYSIVLCDLPGQGRSTILSGTPAVSFDEQVDALHGVIMQTKRNGKVNLAAASWGTIISAALASRYPDLVEKMILGGFGAKPSKAVIEVIKEGQRLFNTDKTTEIAPLMIEKFGQHIPESFRNQMIEQFQGMNRDQFLSFYEHCEFVEQAKDIEDFIKLGNISASTLIVCGEYDAIMDPGDTEKASTRIPDCEFKMIPKVGHFLHFEQASVLYTYSEFLAR